uniref:Uncharacterized protein n=1 Tax=Anguilla anguilla TaxID=7936 RepID=A0A0E9UIY6_ANGAN
MMTVWSSAVLSFCLWKKDALETTCFTRLGKGFLLSPGKSTCYHFCN